MKYGIIGLVFIFLVLIGGVALLGRDRNTNTKTTAPIIRVADYSNSNTARVSWTMQGRLVGEDERKAIRITVSRDKRIAEILSGYDERVEKVVEFTNTAAGFDAFTRALDNLGFGRERKVAITDERGVCPSGKRYIYRLTDGSEQVMRTWSTSCNRNQGTFNGVNAGPVQQLFRQQITDYNKFVSGISF